MKQTLALVVALLLLVFAADADAQQASRSTFLKLMDVQKMWEAEDYTTAMAELEELINKTRGDAYDYALANQYMAHTCVLADCPERSRTALEEALAQPNLPDELLATLTLFYAQVVLVDEEYEIARQNFERWLTLIDTPPDPAQLFSAAYANYQTERYDRANVLIQQAIESEANPIDSWYRLHYQILFQLERYEEGENILLGLVSRSPDEETYWRLLANHHLRLEDGRKALAVMTIAFQMDMLAEPEDQRRIVSLYSFVETPERAARLLESMVDTAVVESDFDTLKQLGNLWLLSRERSKAVEVLKKAAVVDERRFLFLIQQHPTFALELMGVMSRRLRRMNRHSELAAAG